MEINLTELFEVQRKLDAEIEKKHPTEPGEDRLAKRILALQVELGECANEWRGFKFWSTDQKSRMMIAKRVDPTDARSPMVAKYPLLEEYVDCLHFILSIGLPGNFYLINFENERKDNFLAGMNFKDKTIEAQFNNIFYFVSQFDNTKDMDDYVSLVLAFLALGEMLGFTWEQVTDAYMSKNAINHQRQAEGY